jgi:hypothetical protein
VATAAQIEANRRNAQRSTGPKTAKGKARVRSNAVKHGAYARKLMPVLPQEHPAELERRIQDYISDMQPRNAIERDLVHQAARLAHAIERAERIESAHLAGRVREAMETDDPSARRLEEVRELGRRLLYIVAPEDPSYPNPPGSDDPAVIVRGLEETAEGCRWLLARWAELRNLMTHKSWWGTAPMVRFIRLQGKQPIEAFYDPALNSVFLAWDVLAPKAIDTFWHLYRKSASFVDPAYNHLQNWADLAPRPQSGKEAMAILWEIVDEQVGRLEELLARHEVISAEEAAARADRAALDCSKDFERHRRYQSARTRELLRTLETLRRMRHAELGMGNGVEDMTDDTWQIAEGKCLLTDASIPVAENEGQVAVGEPTAGDESFGVEVVAIDREQYGEAATDGTSDPTTGQDCNLVVEYSTSDEMGILCHEGINESDLAGQRDDVAPWFTERESARRIEPIKANAGSKQDPMMNEFTSVAAGLLGCEQTQGSPHSPVFPLQGAKIETSPTCLPVDWR